MATNLSEDYLFYEATTWFLGSVHGKWRGSLEKTRVPPYMAGDPHGISYCDEDLFAIADGNFQTVYCLTRDYKILWEHKFSQYSTPEEVDYSEELDRVLTLVDHDGVFEFDRRTGALTNHLSHTKLGPLGKMSEFNIIEYKINDPSHFYIADTGNHVVLECDWKGNIYWQYGMFGKRSDEIWLPAGVSQFGAYPRQGGWPGTRMLIISDEGLDRVTAVYPDGDNSVDWMLPFPEPRAKHLPSNLVSLVSGGAFSSVSRTDETRIGWHASLAKTHASLNVSYILDDSNKTMARYVIPSQSNPIVSPKRAPHLVMLMWNWGAFEIDLRRWKNFVVPCSFGWSKEIGSQGWDSPPIPDWGFSKKVINLHSDKGGVVQVLQAGLLNKGWDGTWNLYDSIRIEEGRFTHFSIGDGLGIFKLKLVPGGASTVRLFVNMT